MVQKGAGVCEEQCFVSRNNLTGYVTQGCGSCPTNDTTECQECKEVYCNEESKVYKHCLADNDGICKTAFDAPCYLWRTPTNGVKKGCGICPFFTCKDCNTHRCNNETELPFYCFGFMASYKECSESVCYIAKIEEKIGDKKIQQYHYDCGKCPSDILDLSPYIKTKQTTFLNKFKNLDMSKMQCAECSNSPACNADTYFEKQMFCWEKDVKKWTPTRGRRVCGESCFIGVDANEMGFVQGCGSCPSHLEKCATCNTPYCNDKNILPTIKCHYNIPKTKLYKKKVKKCHPMYTHCYIAKDKFGRGNNLNFWFFPFSLKIF
uniref:Uncharacterized protein n=1 Tax=Meloidogyne enterolobii TaxID=390850 RepID=A0A6V7VIB3_MELEN|nr:unnamed protein product [Meloidogyne enterolobii]